MQTIKKRIILLVAILLWSCVSVFAGEACITHFLKDSYASGERTVKSSGENAAMFVNAEFAGGTTNTAKFSLYVSPYLVANQGGRYTKHIYIGSQRIVSKLGDLKSYGADPRRIEYAGSESDGPKVDYKTKYALQQQVIKDNFAHFDVPYNGADNNDYVDGKGFSERDGSLKSAMLKAAMAKEGNKSAGLKDNFQQGDSYEQYQYFYHPDHLGSSSFITNTEGEVVQHIEYVPYGEVFIEERNNVWNTPYLFNAKEFDEETGLYYYGARYYDSRLSMWYGVDALAEKYPNMSPYNYCVGNPVKLVDVDGNDWVESENGGCVWNENVNSKLETPKGFRYIGTDSDLLAYMGLWEQFSDMRTNTIGYVYCDPSVGCHMTNLQVKSHLDINIMKDGDNKLSGISIVSTNVSSNTGSSEGQIVENSRMSINYGGNKLSATLVPITNEDIFYKTGTTVTKASITIPSRLLCHNKKLESVCVEENWSVIDPSTKRHHTFVITHGLFPKPKTYNHTWEKRTKSSRVHSIFDSYCRFNNHLWNLLMPNVRK